MSVSEFLKNLIHPTMKNRFEVHLDRAFIWKHPQGHRKTVLLFSLVDDDRWRAWYVFYESVLALNRKDPRQHVYHPFDDYTANPKGFTAPSLGEPTTPTVFIPRRARRVDRFFPSPVGSAHLVSPRVSKGFVSMQLELHFPDGDEILNLQMKYPKGVELPGSSEHGMVLPVDLIWRGSDRDSVGFHNWTRP